MSFFKELFEKRKDKKYGKGHRLGDTEASSPRLNESSQSQYQNVPQTEAARKAGEAALQRLQQQTSRPTQRPTSSYATQTKEELLSQNKEYQKALDLKEHYFGKQTVVDNYSTSSKVNIYYKSSVLRPDERYPLSGIEDKIEQSILQQLDQEPILVSVSLLFTANYKTQEKLDKCVEIINKFIENILKSPNDEKYRKIRLENPIFKEKVYSCKYADMVLKQAGFKPMTIKQETSEQEEDFFVYEGNNFEKLENLKSALSLAEPIVPELDRDIKIFKISNTTLNTSLNDFSLGEDFFNPKIEELRKEQALRNEAVEKAGMLRTKAMRERDEQLELRRYNYSLIRVRFPDNFILQGLFKSNEKYQELFELIKDCLEVDSIPFDFVGHSLKKPVANNSNMLNYTFAELGLAPSALLNFRISDLVEDKFKSSIKHYLKIELIKLAQNF